MWKKSWKAPDNASCCQIHRCDLIFELAHLKQQSHCVELQNQLFPLFIVTIVNTWTPSTFQSAILLFVIRVEIRLCCFLINFLLKRVGENVTDEPFNFSTIFQLKRTITILQETAWYDWQLPSIFPGYDEVKKVWRVGYLHPLGKSNYE